LLLKTATNEMEEEYNDKASKSVKLFYNVDRRDRVKNRMLPVADILAE
jgi:hypothetical protein